MSILPKSIPQRGLYIYPDVARYIAVANNLSDLEQNELYFEMASAIVAGSLKARNPRTGGPAKNISSPYVTNQDINTWLANNGYPFTWNIILNSPISTTSSSKSATQANVFQSMDNLTPEELSITFVGDKHDAGMGNSMLEISARKEKRKVALSEIGLVDRRKGHLNFQGTILLGMARKKKSTSSNVTTKKISRLRKVLKNYLGINSDLFLPYNKSYGWSPRFKLNDKLGAADYRAKIEAERKTDSWDQKIESGEKSLNGFEYDDIDGDDEAAEWLKDHDK